MEEKIITLRSCDHETKCLYHKSDIKYLHAFLDIEDNFELFENELLETIEEYKFEKVWFIIPNNYDLKFSNKKIWRVYDEFIIVNGVEKILVYYSADGKKFLKDLILTEMDNETKTRLNEKFPGTLKHIKSNKVDEKVVIAVVYNFVNGDLDKCTFDIQDKNIDLIKITQFVKDTMGRKFASSHIMALRELRRKLNETNK